MKYCKDCKHYDKPFFEKAICKLFPIKYEDLVNGVVHIQYKECQELRGNYNLLCGKEGYLFEKGITK